MPFTFAAGKQSIRYFWGVIIWMLSTGWARHPGPRPPGCSVEFLNVGGRLS